MMDINKLSRSVDDLVRDDAAIRERLRQFEKSVQSTQPGLTEASRRQSQHRQQVLSIMKKMMGHYAVELDAALHILMDVTGRQDRTLAIAAKMQRVKEGVS